MAWITVQVINPFAPTKQYTAPMPNANNSPLL